jgi:hypothetical protein
MLTIYFLLVKPTNNIKILFFVSKANKQIKKQNLKTKDLFWAWE